MQQHAYPVYSQYLFCLYDEPAPVGHIGRGAHYSVFRSLTWHSEKGERLSEAAVHNLAVIWDEDHDIRIISCIEALLIAGLLHHVVFIGERQGGVTIVLDRLSAAYLEGTRRREFEASVTRVINYVVEKSLEDSWYCTFGDMNETILGDSQLGKGTFHRMLIRDETAKVDTYLRNIENLWALGVNRIR